MSGIRCHKHRPQNLVIILILYALIASTHASYQVGMDDLDRCLEYVRAYNRSAYSSADIQKEARELAEIKMFLWKVYPEDTGENRKEIGNLVEGHFMAAEVARRQYWNRHPEILEGEIRFAKECINKYSKISLPYQYIKELNALKNELDLKKRSDEQ